MLARNDADDTINTFEAVDHPSDTVSEGVAFEKPLTLHSQQIVTKTVVMIYELHILFPGKIIARREVQCAHQDFG